MRDRACGPCQSRQVDISYKKKEIPAAGSAVVRTEERPIIGTDEVRSSAGSEEYKIRIRPAINRDTRQTDGAASGDRGDEACRNLRKSLPAG